MVKGQKPRLTPYKIVINTINTIKLQITLTNCIIPELQGFCAVKKLAAPFRSLVIGSNADFIKKQKLSQNLRHRYTRLKLVKLKLLMSGKIDEDVQC